MGSGPAIIAGDLNADYDDLALANTTFARDGWVDAGTCHALGEAAPGRPTCGPAGRLTTRRDYIIFSSGLLPYVRSFRVVDTGLFPTHALLHLRISTAVVPFKTRGLIRVQSAALNPVEKRHGTRHLGKGDH